MMKEEESVWMPVQTVYNKELLVADYFKQEGLEYYLPMTYRLDEHTDSEGRCHRQLVPAIHNLLFVRHPYNMAWCRKLTREIPFPLYFLKRERQGGGYCTVRDEEMRNFMRATDPEIEGTRFIDSRNLLGKRSVPVRVIRKGPLYGLTGKFLRYGGKHYIAVEMPQSAALLKVSFTWCEIITEPTTV